MPERLADRIARVMGGGSVAEGNGKAGALNYAREGAAVFVVDRNEDATGQTAGLIRDEGGTSAEGVGDVSIDDDIEQWVAQCMAAFGRIDILRNNVARIDVEDVTGLVSDPSDAGFSVNLERVFLACRHVIGHMRARKTGAIVNISSIAAARYLGVPYMPYDARKAGIVPFTRAIAVRHAADGIRANTILPGFMDTPHVHAFLRDHPGGGDTEARSAGAAVRPLLAAWAPPGTWPTPLRSWRRTRPRTSLARTWSWTVAQPRPRSPEEAST